MALSIFGYQILLVLVGIIALIFLCFLLVYRFLIVPKRYIPKNHDYQVFITKDNRFELASVDMSKDIDKKNNKFEYDGDKYYVVESCSILNRQGKSLMVYSKGKPQPLEISYNKSKWLDNQSINAILNNEYVPMLLQLKAGWRDILLIVITITSIGAFFIALFIALKIFGVIHGKTEIVQIQANQLQVVR